MKIIKGALAVTAAFVLAMLMLSAITLAVAIGVVVGVAYLARLYTRSRNSEPVID